MPPVEDNNVDASLQPASAVDFGLPVQPAAAEPQEPVKQPVVPTPVTQQPEPPETEPADEPLPPTVSITAEPSVSNFDPSLVSPSTDAESPIQASSATEQNNI